MAEAHSIFRDDRVVLTAVMEAAVIYQVKSGRT